MSLPGNTDNEKFTALCALSYKEQSVWFLNAFWNTLGEVEAERIWAYTDKCGSLDLQNGKNGNGLDEMMAHRFLEEFKETLTVRELRDTLRRTGAIGEAERPKIVPISHYLLFRYNANWHHLVNAVQGDNQEELQKAQQLVRDALNALKVAEDADKAAKIAQAELEAAMAELKRQEEEYNNKVADAQRRSEEGGVVSRNKAKAELAQLQAEDPLPLRRAKLTTEAAIKKAEKTRIAAEETLLAAQQSFKAAEDYLEEVKSRSGSAQGGLWWMSRELHESKKYMPVSKGGIAKK